MLNSVPIKDDDVGELRRLILGAELEKLNQLSDRLGDSEKLLNEVSEALPQAIGKSAKQGSQLSEAMLPVVEEIVQLSIKRDINVFANALFPVMGPAIRKSISETIRQMLQSLNQILEHSLSWQGVKWRIESLRTGIPFAQIILLNSFEFRVEQVFMIHRENGILLCHIEQEETFTQDVDMVSSMLSAIKDFVNDSFYMDDQQQLDSIQVGNFSILIERGPDIILATASRGNVPLGLRSRMQLVLEELQSQYKKELTKFSGDTSQFKSCREQLLTCLEKSEQKNTHKGISLKAKLILLMMFVLASYWAISKTYLSMEQQEYIDLLEQEAGFVVARIVYDGDQLIINGLRDPLAQPAEQLIALTSLDPKKVTLQFKSYQSLDQEIVKLRLKRAIDIPLNLSIKFKSGLLVFQGYASQAMVDKINAVAPMVAGVDLLDTNSVITAIDLSSLTTPKGVRLTLDIDKGLLISSGSATLAWQRFAREQVKKINGIRLYDDSQLSQIQSQTPGKLKLSTFNPPKSVSMKMVKNILVISGRANSDWINSVIKVAKTYAEIHEIDLDQLQNTNEEQLRQDIKKLQNITIFFESGSTLDLKASSSFEQINHLVLRIIANSNKLSKPVQISIKGFSDSIGRHNDNVLLSMKRAKQVAKKLSATGIDAKYIIVKGLEAVIKEEKTAQGRSYNRRVVFEVLFSMPKEAQL